MLFTSPLLGCSEVYAWFPFENSFCTCNIAVVEGLLDGFYLPLLESVIFLVVLSSVFFGAVWHSHQDKGLVKPLYKVSGRLTTFSQSNHVG